MRELERCDEEISRCECALRAGSSQSPEPEDEMLGCLQGLMDWTAEKRLILAAQKVLR